MHLRKAAGKAQGLDVFHRFPVTVSDHRCFAFASPRGAEKLLVASQTKVMPLAKAGNDKP